MDYTALLPQTAFWALLYIVFLFFFKFQIAPALLQFIVETAPIDCAEVKPLSLNLKTFNSTGIQLKFRGFLPHTKLPFPWIKPTCITVYTVAITDQETNQIIAYCSLSDPIVINALADVMIDQLITIDFNESTTALKKIIDRVTIVGTSQLRLVNIRIAFQITIDSPLLYLERIQVGKSINMGEVLEIAKDAASAAAAAASSNHDSRDSSFSSSSSSLDSLDDDADQSTIAEFDPLFPDPDVSAFAKPKGLRCIEAGLNISFSRPPTLCFDIQAITFDVFLHSSRMAKVVVGPLQLGQDPEATDAKFSVVIYPAALSSKPITGAFTSAKGIVKGVLKGAVNGLLFNEWGGEILVLQFKNIQMNNQPWWIGSLLDGLELEYDVDAVKKVRSRRKKVSLQEGIKKLVLAVLNQLKL